MPPNFLRKYVRLVHWACSWEVTPPIATPSVPSHHVSCLENLFVTVVWKTKKFKIQKTLIFRKLLNLLWAFQKSSLNSFFTVGLHLQCTGHHTPWAVGMSYFTVFWLLPALLSSLAYSSIFCNSKSKGDRLVQLAHARDKMISFLPCFSRFAVLLSLIAAVQERRPKHTKHMSSLHRAAISL